MYKEKIKKFSLNKKGQLLGQLGSIFQTLAFLGIFGAIILLIMSELNDSISSGVAIKNMSKDGIANASLGISNVFKQFPLFGTILGLLLIVGVVFILIRGAGQKSTVV